MSVKLRRLYRFLVDIILPNRCPCCDKFIKWDKFICNDCTKKIVYADEKVCSKCGKAECICNKGVYYDGCITLTYYEGVVKEGIHRLKYSRGMNFAYFFDDEIVRKLYERGYSQIADIITCVPMTKSSKAERGYNQSEEIAKIIANKINVPVIPYLLRKQFNNVSQHSLSEKERYEAVKDLFVINKKYDIKDKTIILCDDVLTTGSTLNECSRILKEHGAKAIYCVALATTILKNL